MSRWLGEKYAEYFNVRSKYMICSKRQKNMKKCEKYAGYAKNMQTICRKCVSIVKLSELKTVICSYSAYSATLSRAASKFRPLWAATPAEAPGQVGPKQNLGQNTSLKFY